MSTISPDWLRYWVDREGELLDECHVYRELLCVSLALNHQQSQTVDHMRDAMRRLMDIDRGGE